MARLTIHRMMAEEEGHCPLAARVVAVGRVPPRCALCAATGNCAAPSADHIGAISLTLESLDGVAQARDTLEGADMARRSGVDARCGGSGVRRHAKKQRCSSDEVALSGMAPALRGALTRASDGDAALSIGWYGAEERAQA